MFPLSAEMWCVRRKGEGPLMGVIDYGPSLFIAYGRYANYC